MSLREFGLLVRWWSIPVVFATAVTSAGYFILDLIGVDAFWIKLCGAFIIDLIILGFWLYSISEEEKLEDER